MNFEVGKDCNPRLACCGAVKTIFTGSTASYAVFKKKMWLGSLRSKAIKTPSGGAGWRLLLMAVREIFLFAASDSHAVERAVDEEERDQEENQGQHVRDGRALVAGESDC